MRRLAPLSVPALLAVTLFAASPCIVPPHAHAQRRRTDVRTPPVAPGTTMRPARMYSCMTMPPDGPPMVDASVPHGVEMLAPGHGIVRYTIEEPPPGWSLWRVISGPRREGQSERISHVLGWDGTHVVDGPRLFVALGVDAVSATRLARRALAVLFRRAEESPLRASDNATASATVRGRISEPAIRDGHLVFWARTEPGTPYAHEIDVELRTGRIVHGNVW